MTTAGRPVLLEWLHIFVLCSFAVAQPLFDILSRNAEFFAHRQSQQIDLLLLVVVLSLLLPALLGCSVVLAGWISRAAGRWLHLALVALLGALTLLPVVKRVDALPDGAVVALGAALGVATAIGYMRARFVRTVLTVLAPCVGLFPVLFLFNSPVARLLFPPEEPEGHAAVRVSVAHPAPVVMVVFDELSGISLMDERRQIDAIRFPNFAALAAEATWFRQATTVAGTTDLAIPAILTGKYPRPGLLPRAGDYPENLFTWLGGSYHFEVFESGLRLCPWRLCAGSVTRGVTSRLPSLFLDVSVVYLHLLLPVNHRSKLPPIDATWGSFVGGRDDRSNRNFRSSRSPVDQFSAFLSSIQPPSGPSLYFLRSDLPHVPWHYLPSGKQYGPLDTQVVPHGVRDEVWSADEWEVLQGLQRYLLQVGFVDTLVGRLIARLKALGLYDRALIVVASDHGVTFRSGDTRRPLGGSRQPLTESNYPEVAAIPLFIKAPGQSAGVISDRNVEVIDILPTIASILGAKIPWKLDGRSAVDPAISERPTKSIFDWDGKLRQVRGGRIEGLYEASDRFLSVFGSRPTLQQVFRLGPHAGLLDLRVSDVPATRGAVAVELTRHALYDDVDPGGNFVPAMVEGTVVSSGGPAVLPLAIAVNGTIRATTKTSQRGRGREFSALLPEGAFRRGKNEIQVFLISGAADGRLSLAPTERRSIGEYRLASAESERPGLLSSGRSLTMDQSVGAGFLDVVGIEERGYPALRVVGWAVDMKQRIPADVIVIFEDDKFVYAGRPSVERQDVARELKSDALRWAGFEYRLPFTKSRTVDPRRVRVFAVSRRGVAFELPRLPVFDTVLAAVVRRPVKLIEGAVTGAVEVVMFSDAHVDVIGWAVDVNTGDPARDVIIFADSQIAFAGHPSVERPDVAKAFATDQVRRSGFRFKVPLERVSGSKTPKISVFGVSRFGEASRLEDRVSVRGSAR